MVARTGAAWKPGQDLPRAALPGMDPPSSSLACRATTTTSRSYLAQVRLSCLSGQQVGTRSTHLLSTRFLDCLMQRNAKSLHKSSKREATLLTMPPPLHQVLSRPCCWSPLCWSPPCWSPPWWELDLWQLSPPPALQTSSIGDKKWRKRGIKVEKKEHQLLVTRSKLDLL